MCQKIRKNSSIEKKSNLPPSYFFTQSIPFILIPLKQNLLMSLAAKSTKHWWVFRMLLCLAWKTSPWLGNQHGKHTANIQRHFLCLATGKNLGCFFFCYYVMLLWSLGTMWLPQKEKEKDLLHLSSGMNLAWKWLYGDLWAWVTRQGKDREWAPPPVGPWLPPGPALQLRDLQHFLFWEGWELTVFYEMNMTQKSIQHDLPMHLKEYSAVLCITECLSPCLLKHSLNPQTCTSSRPHQPTLGPELPQLLAGMPTWEVRGIHVYQRGFSKWKARSNNLI